MPPLWRQLYGEIKDLHSFVVVTHIGRCSRERAAELGRERAPGFRESSRPGPGCAEPLHCCCVSPACHRLRVKPVHMLACLRMHMCPPAIREHSSTAAVLSRSRGTSRSLGTYKSRRRGTCVPFPLPKNQGLRVNRGRGREQRKEEGAPARLNSIR